MYWFDVLKCIDSEAWACAYFLWQTHGQVRVMGECDVQYVTCKSLATRDRDVLSFIEIDIFILEIEKIFWPKASKNGWWYDALLSVGTTKSILMFYQRIMRKMKVMK
jgi:hypothetical protein